MTDREVKKELIVHYLTNLVSDIKRKDELFNIVQTAMDANVFETSWEHIYPMSKFDDVMMFHRPIDIAQLVEGEDMSMPYFAYGGLYVFNTFAYDEMDAFFPFADIADAVLEDNCDWDEHLQHICDLDLDDVRFQIIKCITRDDISNIVASFNYFLTETRGCDEQIFHMDEDLETVWFGIMGCDGQDERFMEQMTLLYESIKSGVFHITDRYWEMTTVDDMNFIIRSFNELWDSENFVRLEKDYANDIILSHDDEFLSEEVAHNLEELFVTYGI